jgi:FtsP/CotA-like multicopper oxidase with cupredoxin domain
MLVTRRRMLRGGGAVALWALSPGAFAQGRTLTAGPVALKLTQTSATAALGYEGACPGPLLRARVGEQLSLTFENRLAEPTSLAFPGLRVPRAQLAFGGLGAPPIAAGASREIVLTPQEPGFQIYGALVGPDPRQQFTRGLYGPLIVDEPTPPEIDLEAVVLVADWRLEASGALENLGDAALGQGVGRTGGLITANGAPAPLQLSGPPGGRVRLRLGNCAAARVLYLAIEGVRPLVVAVDGQPSAPFEPLHNLLPVGTGARFELLFDLPREPGALVRFYLRPDDTRSQEHDEELLTFATSGAAAKQRPAIVALPGNPRLPAEIALEAAHRTELLIGGGGSTPLTINGAASPTKPLFTVPRGAPVTLTFTNKTALSQTMRMTGHVARLLHALDDGWDPYWRDIFIIPAGKTVHVAFVADNPGLWPLESANPERRHAGLMATFLVG